MADEQPKVPEPEKKPEPEKPHDDNEDSAAEIEAKAHLLEAEKGLVEVKHNLIDRLIMRGGIPLALIVAGPMTTYYFSQRANDGIEEVRRIGDSVEKLDDLIETIQGSAARHDEARATELVALRRIVSSLQWTIVVSQVRDVVQRTGRPQIEAALRSPNSAPNTSFSSVRARVEADLFTDLAPRLDADPQLVRDSIRGAMDELATEFTGRESEPRFPTKGQ